MNATLKREGDRVWIEGVQPWFVGDKESSVHAAEEVVLCAAGEDVSYDHLLGFSGLAFRMQIHKDGFCGSSPHSLCGYKCVKGSLNSLPRKPRIFEVKAEDAKGVAEARAAVVASIEQGVPVQYGNEEDGVIVGYQKGGAAWLCHHPFHKGGKSMFVETKWPWGIAVFTERKAVPPRRELVIAGLEQAGAMDRAGEAEAYWVGQKAWANYIEKLKALDQSDEKTVKGSMQGNAWIYECLAQYRDSGARFLKAVSDDLGPRAAPHLRRAADTYDRMANQVLRDARHCVVTIAPYPFMLKPGETWTPAMRAEQVRRLEAALPLEREALREIVQALAASDGGTR